MTHAEFAQAQRDWFQALVKGLTEMHGGEFSGHHGRYILRSKLHFAGSVAK